MSPGGGRPARTVDVRVPKASELVAGHLRRRIILGTLREGDALPSEAGLMTEFGVSRPTLREAVRILESERLITVRRGAHGGARVQEPSTEVAARYAGLVLQHRGVTLEDVLAARVVVEAPAVGILAQRRDRASVATSLQERLDSMSTDDPESFHEFNDFIVELAGNETLLLLTAMLEHISTAAALTFHQQRDGVADPRLGRSARRARQKLIDLIRSGDAAGAEKLWRAHLVESGRLLIEGVPSRGVVDLLP